jgi:hypothetical protein
MNFESLNKFLELFKRIKRSGIMVKNSSASGRIQPTGHRPADRRPSMLTGPTGRGGPWRGPTGLTWPQGGCSDADGSRPWIARTVFPVAAEDGVWVRGDKERTTSTKVEPLVHQLLPEVAGGEQGCLTSVCGRIR